MTTPAIRRKAFIHYQLEVRGITQRDVAKLAQTTPTSVARIIGGRLEGDHAPAVWKALATLTKFPQHVLKDPPKLVTATDTE